MAKLTGSEFAEKWARNIKQSITDIQRGIERVSEAPGQKAAAKKAKWVARMTDAQTHEKWATRVAAVSLDEWKARAREVGTSRIPSGADAAVGKMANFGEQLLSHIDAGLGKIKGMPDVTLADTKARMDAWFDHMSKFRPRR